MTPIRKLKGLTRKEVSILEQNNIQTIETIWMLIGKDETQIDSIGSHLGGRDRILELLTTDGLRQSRTLGDSWLARHWLDLLLALLLIVITVFVVRARGAIFNALQNLI